MIALYFVVIFSIVCLAVWAVTVAIWERFKSVEFSTKLKLLLLVAIFNIGVVVVGSYVHEYFLANYAKKLLETEYNLNSALSGSDLKLKNSSVYLSYGEVKCCLPQAVETARRKVDRLFIWLPLSLSGGDGHTFEVFAECSGRSECRYIDKAALAVVPVASGFVQKSITLKEEAGSENCKDYKRFLTTVRICRTDVKSDAGTVRVTFRVYAERPMVLRIFPEFPTWDVRPIITITKNYITDTCQIYSDLHFEYKGCLNV